MNLYKSAVVYLLRGRKTFLIPVVFNNYMTAALKLLKKLYKVTLGDGVGARVGGSVLRASLWETSHFSGFSCFYLLLWAGKS